jgi:hypothetical protein
MGEGSTSPVPKELETTEALGRGAGILKSISCKSESLAGTYGSVRPLLFLFGEGSIRVLKVVFGWFGALSEPSVRFRMNELRFSF